MKATLIINNQEIEVEISEEEYKKLQPVEKKTGYERVKEGDRYYHPNYRGEIESPIDERVTWDDDPYNIANYYSSKEVAENNARADQLMRQLRRFAVEHRESELDYDNRMGLSFIGYSIDGKDLIVLNVGWAKIFGNIIFDSKETAQLAIDTFHDELIWYFTEYKDSL